MISYFENELREIDASIHSLDEVIFRRWVEEGTQTINSGRNPYEERRDIRIHLSCKIFKEEKGKYVAAYF